MRTIGSVKRVLLVIAIFVTVCCFVELLFDVSIFNISFLKSSQGLWQLGPHGITKYRLNKTAAKVLPGHGEQCKIPNKLVIFARFKPESFARNKFRSLKAQAATCRLPGATTCEFTEDEGQYTTADVLYVHECFHDRAERAHPRQILLHYNLGPEIFPCNTGDSTQADMRISYTSSSTITLPYLCLAGVRQHTLNALAMSPPTNRRKVAMFVSDCNSKFSKWRREYLRQLMNHIQIDSYGLCFHNTEMRTTRKDHDYFKLKLDLIRNKRYKFLISFENSVIREYVTEKIWHAYMTQTIPIYYGAPEIYDQVPGANTLIDAAKFAGPKQLAEYIKQVDNDDSLYRSYFKFDINHTIAFQKKYCTKNVACEICKKSFEFKKSRCS